MSAGRASLRRSLTPSAALLVVVALITAAVALGTQVAGSRTLARPLGDARGDTYAQNAIGRLAPVSAQFTERRLNRTQFRTTTETTTVDEPRRATTPSTVPRNESIVGAPGSFPGLAPGGWVLHVAMAPNEPQARAGDEVRYRMTVTNTGTDEFRGRSFTLQWHTPTGTVARNGLDQCSLLVLPVLQALCASQRLLIAPGFGEARHDSFNSSGLIAIDPGEQFTHDWFVQILPTAVEGTTYINHAHLTVSINGRDHTISTDDVTVTVVA